MLVEIDAAALFAGGIPIGREEPIVEAEGRRANAPALEVEWEPDGGYDGIEPDTIMVYGLIPPELLSNDGIRRSALASCVPALRTLAELADAPGVSTAALGW